MHMYMQTYACKYVYKYVYKYMYKYMGGNTSLTSLKKTITEIAERSRDRNTKSTQTRVVEMITYNRHPYITHTLQLHEDIVMVELCMCV